MVTGYWQSQIVYVSAKLAISDLLQDGPRTAEGLARQTGAHAPSLYRLLRAAASLGLYAEEPDGRFALAPLGELLHSEASGSQRSMALMMGEEHFRAWGDLLYSVQTGQPAFEKQYGQPIFEFLAEHPEKAAIFDEAMVAVHGREARAVLDAYDFSQVGKLADIGGGNGSQLRVILDAYPDMQGVLFDVPNVVERANPVLEQAGLTERVHLISGDFFESVPAGADAYLLRHIIHDWDDSRAIRILENVHAVMAEGGRLLVIESVIPPGNEPFFAKLLDLTMLTIPGGRERTADEYRQLFQAAGFRVVQFIATRTEVSLIEGMRLD